MVVRGRADDHRTMSVALRDRTPRLGGQALLRAIAEGMAGSVGEDFLRVLARTMAEAFGAKLAFVGEAMRGWGACAGRRRVARGGCMEESFDDALACGTRVVVNEQRRPHDDV